MPEPPTWPPPPNLPAPLSEHDDFLIACIRDWAPKRPILRLQLASKLCGKTGMEFSSCRAVVNNFCDRHAILVPAHGLAIWSPFLMPLVMQTLLLIMNYVLEHRHNAAVTRMEQVMITAEQQHLDSLYWYIYAGVMAVALVLAYFRDKKTRRQAVEAKAKFE